MRASGWMVVLSMSSLVAVPAAAAPVVVHGTSYPSWAAYVGSAYFQDHGLRCGTDAWRDRLSKNRARPSLLGSAADCGLDLTNPSDEYAPGHVYDITVVVHRLESVTGDGVFPDSLVRTQIDVLNEDYLALFGTPGGQGTDTRIHFTLATTDPDGNPSPGWTRTQNEFWFNDLPDPINGNYYDALAWDPNRYLNIYTLSPEAPGGVVLGYVPFLPQDGGAGTNEDGVRCLWNAFGRQSTNAPYDLGRTVTHEVGHYFGLYHVFQDGCAADAAPGCYSQGDRICDTESDSTSHGGCPVTAMSCGNPDPIRNYLEYTDDACMTNFTFEQARRMRCTIVYYRPSIFREVVLAADPAPHRPIAALAQNHPNPFGRSTELRFELARPSRVALVVIDAAGRTVRHIASGSFAQGSHRFTWDGADESHHAAAPGVYFYRLTTDLGAETRRMILVD